MTESSWKEGNTVGTMSNNTAEQYAEKNDAEKQLTVV